MKEDVGNRPRRVPWVPSVPRRDLIAFASAFLTYAAVQGGLFYLVPHLQAAVMVGSVAALLSASRSRAAVCAVAAFVVGTVVLPGTEWNPADLVVTFAGAWGAALVASTCRSVIDDRPRSSRNVLGLAVAIIVANMWVTTILVDTSPQVTPNGAQVPPLPAVLDGALPAHLVGTDDALWHEVRRSVLGGTPYYQAYAEAFQRQNHLGLGPPEALDVRLPTVFWLFALIRAPWVLICALLLLTTAAIGSVLLLSSGVVRAPLAVPACAAVAAYMLAFTTSSAILFAEPWAAVLGVLSLGLFGLSCRSQGRRSLVATVVSAGCALLGALLREPAAVLLVAGVAAAWVSHTDRRLALAAWGGALLLFAAAYAAHTVVVRPFLSHAWRHHGLGGLGNVIAGLEYNTMLLAHGTWLPFLLAALGVLGAAVLPDRRARVFATVTVVLFLAAFFLVSHGGRTTGGQTWNYWGALLNPLLYAMSPAAVLLLADSSGRTDIRGGVPRDGPACSTGVADHAREALGT